MIARLRPAPRPAAGLAWLVGAITADAAPAPARLRATAISAARGLAIYRHAYRARLRECLADDFPAVRALLGEADFDALADRTIDRHPPHAATLNRYGRMLLRGLRRDGPARDLARLEWALVEAIHAPLADPLPPAALAGIADWSALRLVPAPSLTVIASRHPVDLLYRQHLRGQRPDPGAAGGETVLALRRRDGLHRLALPSGQGRLLAALVRGRSLGDALSRADLGTDEVRQALAAAMGAGCFTAIRPEPA